MPHSTTHWVHQLKAGNRDAAQELWERYYRRLVELARRRLSTKAVNGVADEDDIALSAFASFYRAAEAGRFPQLADRNDLWRLLLVITQRKVSHQIRHQHRRKRRPEHVAGGAIDAIDLDEVAGNEITPDFCAAAVESFRGLLDSLSDSTLRSLALMKMEGYTNAEIAKVLDCSLSTIERKLRRIRHEWSSAIDASEERSNE